MSEHKLSRQVEVRNSNGLHLRPLEQFAKTAAGFDAKIEVIASGVRVDGTSLLNLLTLGAAQGTQLVIEAQGPQADAALDALATLVEVTFAKEETTGQEQSS